MTDQGQPLVSESAGGWFGVGALFAFYRAHRSQPDCEPGKNCAIPANRRRQRLLLWIITLVTVALLTFPYCINLIL